MMTRINRREIRQRIKQRSRDKLQGTADRPRLSVFRSLKHVSVQAIADDTQKVVASASTYEKDIRAALKEKTGNQKAAGMVGTLLGQKLKTQGVDKAVFDRNGFKYHGVVKSLADAVRAAGIKF